MRFLSLPLALLAVSVLALAQTDNSPDPTDGFNPNSTDVGSQSGNTTAKSAPEPFHGGGGHGQPRYCKPDYKLCRYKQDHDWHTRRDCCKPDEICRKDKGCRKCPTTSKGPHGGLITDVEFGKHAKRETVYWVDSPEACCRACADRDKCSGFAWSVKKHKCYLSISDRCEPVEYREKKGGDYPDHIFVVGGSACSDWKAKYRGYDYDWYKVKSKGAQEDEPGVDEQSG